MKKIKAIASKYFIIWLIGMAIPLASFVFITDFGMTQSLLMYIQLPFLVFQTGCFIMVIIHMVSKQP